MKTGLSKDGPQERSVTPGDGQSYSAGWRLHNETEYQEHLEKVLPGREDVKVLEPLFKAGNWIAGSNA